MVDGGVPPDAVAPIVSRVSSTVEDWSREHKAAFAWDPARALLAALRDYQRRTTRAPSLQRRLLQTWALLRHRFWSVVTGTDIPVNSRIAGGLLMPHPNGIVIHPEAEIGPNCLIFQQVTIASTDDGAPRIAGHVDIGAGAKVLGPVHIGEHARIGANAVVIDDVPSGCTVGGIPAKLLVSRKTKRP